MSFIAGEAIWGSHHTQCAEHFTRIHEFLMRNNTIACACTNQKECTPVTTSQRWSRSQSESKAVPLHSRKAYGKWRYSSTHS